jgi:hypothetical protein
MSSPRRRFSPCGRALVGAIVAASGPLFVAGLSVSPPRWPTETEKKIFEELRHQFGEKRRVLLEKAPHGFGSPAAAGSLPLQLHFCNIYRRGQIEILDVATAKMDEYLRGLNGHFRASSSEHLLHPFPRANPALQAPIPSCPRLALCAAGGVFATLATAPIKRGELIHVYGPEQILSFQHMADCGALGKFLAQLEGTDEHVLRVLFLVLVQSPLGDEDCVQPIRALLEAVDQVPFLHTWPASLRAHLDKHTLEGLEEAEQDVDEHLATFTETFIEVIPEPAQAYLTRTAFSRALRALGLVTFRQYTAAPVVLLEANALRHHEFPNAELVFDEEAHQLGLRALADLAPGEELLVWRGFDVSNALLLVEHGYVLPAAFNSTATLQLSDVLAKDMYARIAPCLDAWHMAGPRTFPVSLGVPRVLLYAFAIAALSNDDLRACADAALSGQPLRLLPCIVANESEGRALLKDRLAALAAQLPAPDEHGAGQATPLSIFLNSKVGLAHFAASMLLRM